MTGQGKPETSKWEWRRAQPRQGDPTPAKKYQSEIIGNSWHLVGLLQSVEQRLESSKVTNQLEDPQNPHNPHLRIITLTRSFIVRTCPTSLIIFWELSSLIMRTSLIIFLMSTKNVVDPHNSSQKPDHKIRMMILRTCPTSLMILLVLPMISKSSSPSKMSEM